MELNACVIKGNEKLQVFIMVELWNYNQAQFEVLWFPFRWSLSNLSPDGVTILSPCTCLNFCILNTIRNCLIPCSEKCLVQCWYEIRFLFKESNVQIFFIDTYSKIYIFLSKKWDYPFPNKYKKENAKSLSVLDIRII